MTPYLKNCAFLMRQSKREGREITVRARGYTGQRYTILASYEEPKEVKLFSRCGNLVARVCLSRRQRHIWPNSLPVDRRVINMIEKLVLLDKPTRS